MHTADATGVHWATGTGQDEEKSGLTTYNARAPRGRLATVVTVAGVITTADIMKTSLFPAPLIRVHQQPLHARHVHPAVWASLCVLSAYSTFV